MKNKIVTFGEILLRLATPDHLRFSQARKFNVSYGGGEANVAVSLANYGMNACFVTRLPQNDLGRACEMRLNKYGVKTDHLIYGGDKLGIYFLETGAVSRSSKVVYDRQCSSFAGLEPGMIHWDAVFEDACWFHWSGISAAISQGGADVLAEGIEIANQKGITVSCDVNLRENLWKYGKLPKEVMPALIAKSDVVFGNEYDAEHAMGIPLDEEIIGKFTKESFLRSSREVMKYFPNVKKIVTTRRGNINASHNTLSALLFDGDKLIETDSHDLSHIVDRVGGGDAFTGGLIYGFLNWPGEDPKTLSFALAASCLKHSVAGDFNLVTLDEIDQEKKR